MTLIETNDLVRIAEQLGNMVMDRLEEVRQRIDSILWATEDREAARCGFVHLYGVAQIAVMLAIRRGIEPSICGVAGMLHDLSSYKTGDSENHALLSALEARSILLETSRFTPGEVEQVCEAIEGHSDKEDMSNGPVGETLKDADVLQHYLYKAGSTSSGSSNDRLLRVLREFNS